VSEPFDRPRFAPDEEERPEEDAFPSEGADDTSPDEALDRGSENVLEDWPSPSVDPPPPELTPDDAMTAPELPAAAPAALRAPGSEPQPEPQSEPLAPLEPAVATTSEHAPGELVVPPGLAVLEGTPRGERRAVGVVVGRFNGDVTSRLLQSAVDELALRGVAPDAVTVMPVPGAFELPLAAMALAKTRRFACIVALGCVIRGDTPHFDYVAGEAASGLQLAAIETGVPVAFGVLTLDRADQADARVDKGAEAVRTALEMADLFAGLRAAAAR
jgi:6,7-dimethyl-8-ribityllumazine synthase